MCHNDVKIKKSTDVPRLLCCKCIFNCMHTCIYIWMYAAANGFIANMGEMWQWYKAWFGSLVIVKNFSSRCEERKSQELNWTHLNFFGFHQKEAEVSFLWEHVRNYESMHVQQMVPYCVLSKVRFSRGRFSPLNTFYNIVSPEVTGRKGKWIAIRLWGFSYFMFMFTRI